MAQTETKSLRKLSKALSGVAEAIEPLAGVARGDLQSRISKYERANLSLALSYAVSSLCFTALKAK